MEDLNAKFSHCAGRMGIPFIFRHNNKGFFVAANCGDNSFNSLLFVDSFLEILNELSGQNGLCLMG